MNKAKGLNKFIQVSGLLLLLVILPLVSWYYLNRGLDYQIKSRSELKDLGTWSVFDSRLDTLQNTIVFATLDLDYDNDLALEQSLSNLLAQFGERSDFSTVLLFPESEVSDTTAESVMRGYIDRFSGVNKSSIIAFQSKQFNSGIEMSLGYFYLSDYEGVIRNSYNYQNNSEIKRMVEHIALILPRQPETDLIYVPDEEK